MKLVLSRLTRRLSVKNIVLGTLIVFSISSTASANNTFDLKTLIPTAPQVDAQAYILMDYNSGQILVEKAADERRNPASLTKMMTSYIIGQAIKSGKISLNDTVVISANARANQPKFSGSSLMFISQNERITVANLNRGIVIQSGNDACVAMAEHVAGSEGTFVSLMNSAAGSLGMTNSRFETVHGLDAPGQYSTAHDMALLGIALIRDVPNEYAIYSEKEFTYSNIKQQNRNGLLSDKSMAVDGIKTGHTTGAGYNLVVSATEGPMRLVSVVMGSASEATREMQSKALLTWGFRFFETVSPLKAAQQFASQQVWFGQKERVELGVNKDVYLTIPRGRAHDLNASYVLNTSELHAPLTKGQVIGMITFQMDGKTIEQRPLVAMSDVEEGGFFSRVIDYIKLIFHRWFS